MVIRCEYCGTEFNSRKGNCPNCGAASGGNSDIERAKQQDEEALKTFRKIAAANFDKQHQYREHLSPKHTSLIRAMVILIALLLGICAIAFLIYMSTR